jgi:hypothetical protein
MTDLQAFIQDRELELTLVNELPESGYVGVASDIIPKKGEHIIKFPVSKAFKNVCPWTIAVLHSGKRIFKTFYIRPVLDVNVKTIEVVWPD